MSKAFIEQELGLWNGFLDGDEVPGSGKEADLDHLNECRPKHEIAAAYEIEEDLDEVQLFNILIAKKDPIQQRCAVHKMRNLIRLQRTLRSLLCARFAIFCPKPRMTGCASLLAKPCPKSSLTAV